MYKSEIIQLHQLLVNLMKFLVDNGIPREKFSGYLNLTISPHHIYKTKNEHKKAVFLLANEISNVLADSNEIVPTGVARRIEYIWDRLKEDD